MAHVDIDKTVMMLVDNTAQLLKGHGFEMVTEDKKLFPYFTPSLAALKDGRLLVFSISVFPSKGEFQKEADYILDVFKNAIGRNTPESNSRVHDVERVAVVMAPESIEGKTPSGDIHWIGIESTNELADMLRHHLHI